MSPRVLVAALIVALAFAVGVAVAPLVTPPLTSAQAVLRRADTPRATEVYGLGAGRLVSDLVIGGASSPGPGPCGGMPGAGGELAVSCARGTP